MKRVLYGLMTAALLAAGCIPKAPFTWPDDSAPPAEEAAAAARKHASPVRADQVTPENAAQKAREMAEELDNDSRTPLQTADEAPAPSKK